MPDRHEEFVELHHRNQMTTPFNNRTNIWADPENQHFKQHRHERTVVTKLGCRTSESARIPDKSSRASLFSSGIHDRPFLAKRLHRAAWRRRDAFAGNPADIQRT